MKLAVVGSRNYPRLNDVIEYIERQFEISGEKLIIISGGATGVDDVAEQTAKRLGISTIIFKPDRETHGKGAEFIRNKLIIQECDCVIAFQFNNSKGTQNLINWAAYFNKPIILHKL